MKNRKKKIRWPKSLPTIDSPDDFVFRATDKRGHSATIKASIPPELDSIINQLLSSGDFPYRTKQDICRDSLFHRSKELCTATSESMGLSMLQMLQMLENQMVQEQQRASVENTMRDLEINMATSADDPEHQRLLIKDVVKILDSMPSDGLNKYWKDKFVKFVDSKYGHIVKTVRFNMKDRVDED